jgi:hypothetical protein
VYRRIKPVEKLYRECKQLGEDFKKVLRADAAHSRAVDGYKEDIFSASGKFCGTRMKYSDHLLAIMLKADDPDRYADRSKVETTGGFVLNINMGLRDSVRTVALSDDVIEVEEVADALPPSRESEMP